MMIHRAMFVLLACAVSAQAGGWFSGDGIVVGTIRCTNNATIGGTLAVSNSATIGDDLRVGGDLVVSNSAAFGTSLSISNNISFNVTSPTPAAIFVSQGEVIFVGGDTVVNRIEGGSGDINILDSNVINANSITSDYIYVDHDITAAGAFFGDASGLHTFPELVVTTNDVRYLAALTNAWQNPASATNWTWTSDGNEITLTGYTGPNDVVVPDMLDGLPVTGFGTVFNPSGDGSPITSIDAGANVTKLSTYAFFNNTSLTRVILPSVTNMGTGVFEACPTLNSVTFMGDAPSAGNSIYVESPNVTNYVTSPTATGWTNSWNGRPVVRLPLYADNFNAAGVGAVSTNDPRYLATITNSAWLWSGAQIVPAATSSYSIAYGGPAVWNAGSNRYDLLPYSTTNYGAITGTVTITMASNAYLSSIGGDWYIKTSSGTTPQVPVSYSVSYATSTSAVLSAWCSTNPADATSDYYAYFSNLVVYTYDRPDMTPLQYTNDSAGIVARVDPLPTGNTDTRRVVNSASLSAAIAAAKPDIAKEAWAYMPSGARQPTYNAVTLDKPLIQQSAGVTFMQSGDYFAQSYVGTWDATVTGSVWRVGPSGRTALEIASTNINLAIIAFAVRTNVATFVIATNGVVGTPYIEQTADLTAPQWLYVAGQTITNNTTNWTATCSTVATMRFFRAVSPGGANKITSAYSHVFNAGISDGTNAMLSRSLYVVTNANGSGCTIAGFFSVTP